MNIQPPKIENRPYLEGEKLIRGQVWQSGNVFIIPLDEETGIILNAVTNKARGYFYLLEGLDDFEVTSDQMYLTDLIPEMLFNKNPLI